MSITFKINTPEHILVKISKLKQHLPIYEVDNILSNMNQAGNIDDQFSYLSIYQCIEEWKVISFFWNRKPSNKEGIQGKSVIQAIININFSDLKCLFLTKTDLANIQPLTHLKIQSIQEISLSNNTFKSLQPFSKCRFSNFKKLILTKNKYNNVEIRNLSRMKIKQKQQNSHLGLLEYGEAIENGLCNIGYLAKYEAKYLKYLMWIDRRSLNQNVKQKIKMKFSNASLFL